MALGTYDVTPLSMAGAYTLFANNGVMVSPRFITHIVDKSGNEVWSSKPEEKQVLDPRVNFLVVSMMQDVLRWVLALRLKAAALRYQPRARPALLMTPGSQALPQSCSASSGSV